jgi:anti-anti-sigma regulatory factor
MRGFIVGHGHTQKEDETVIPEVPPRLAIEFYEGAALVSFPRRKIDGVAVREIYELAAELTEDRSPRLLIDLDGVVMVTSGVLGIFTASHKLFLHSGGQLHISVADQKVTQQFELMNLHLMLKLFGSRDDALAAFK